MGQSKGILILDYNNSGKTAVAIDGIGLQEMINVTEKNTFEEIIRSWKADGFLLSGYQKDNRMTTKFTFTTNKRLNAYIISLEKSELEMKEIKK